MKLTQHSFQEVMRQWQRMCKSIQEKEVSCKGYCPLGHNPTCGELEYASLEEIKNAETVIMKWAAENPEPLYPSWGEYLASIGVMKPAQPDKAYEVWFTQLYSTNIPADLAEKLGVEPKEV